MTDQPDVQTLKTAMARGQRMGLSTDQLGSTLNCLLNAFEARQEAAQLHRSGKVRESAAAGDMCLDAALGVVHQLAAPELDRILLAGLLGIDNDDEAARDSGRLGEILSQLIADLVQGAGGDPSRVAARSGLQRLLLVLRGLMNNNFAEVCAGSLAAVNVGDVNVLGWIAKPPKGAGKRRSPASEVRSHQGYTAALVNAYYTAGYCSKSVAECLEEVAGEMGIVQNTLVKYRQHNRLLDRCEAAKGKGAAHAALGIVADSPARHSVERSKSLVEPIARGGKKIARSSIVAE